MILAGGARQLAVGDLCGDDVAGLAWSGSPAHLRSVAAALQRAAQGLEDYLVIRAPGGEPVAKMRTGHASEATGKGRPGGQTPPEAPSTPRPSELGVASTRAGNTGNALK